MRSTIREARARLDDLAPSLNPEMYGRLSSEVEAAAKAAIVHAERFYSDQLDKLDVERHELLTEACEVRDEFEALADESQLGRLSARAYGERLDGLTARRDRVEARLAEVDRRLGTLGEVEDDPVSWTDGLFQRYPTTAPEWSF